MISVSTLNNLSSTAGLFDGYIGYVQSVKGRFIYATSSTQTADGRTTLTTSNGGSTRWLFDTSYSHPDWRIDRNQWYIDPSLGDDENDGTQSFPIQTGQELYRRWGMGNIIKQDGNDPNYAVNVHILGDILSPDQLDIDVILDGTTELRVIGDGITVLRSGTADVSGGITTENQTSNIPWQIQDTAFGGNWIEGQRVKFTSGAATDAVCWVAKNQGSGSARLSNPSFSTELSFGIIPSNATPADGDDYDVEVMPKVCLGHFRVGKHGDANAYSSFVNFIDLDLQANVDMFTSEVTNNILWIYTNFYQTAFRMGVCLQGWSLANCLVEEPTGLTPALAIQGTSYVFGGLMLLSTANSWIEYASTVGGNISGDCYIQGGWGLLVGHGVVGNVGIFDVQTEVDFNPNGDGLQAGNPGSGDIDLNGGNVKLIGRVWGSGNAGKGICVREGAACSYAFIPTITGLNGDFQLGSGGKARFFDETSGVYSAAISETWANMATAQPSGFDGQAHNLSEDSHLVPAV